MNESVENITPSGKENETDSFSFPDKSPTEKNSEDALGPKIISELRNNKNKAIMKIENMHTELEYDMFDINNKNNVDSDKLLDNLHKLRLKIFNSINYKLYDKYKLYENVLSNNLCNFIINESEKHALKNNGWTTNRHKNYPTTDIPVQRIEKIRVIINNIVNQEIIPRVADFYKVNKFFLDAYEIFVVKYSFDKQNELVFHKDGSLFSFNILLNDVSEFEGGGTIIKENEKEILIKNSKGGLLIHSGQTLHAGNKITNGTRYILVGFIKYLADYRFVQ